MSHKVCGGHHPAGRGLMPQPPNRLPRPLATIGAWSSKFQTIQYRCISTRVLKSGPVCASGGMTTESTGSDGSGEEPRPGPGPDPNQDPRPDPSQDPSTSGRPDEDSDYSDAVDKQIAGASGVKWTSIPTGILSSLDRYTIDECPPYPCNLEQLHVKNEVRRRWHYCSEYLPFSAPTALLRVKIVLHPRECLAHETCTCLFMTAGPILAY